MGQRNNSNRNATLDDRKERAAGRRDARDREAVSSRIDARGKVRGAFGRDDKANRSGLQKGQTRGRTLDVGRSTQRTRKG